MSKVLSIRMVMDWILILLIFSVMAAITNYIGYSHPIEEALIGMFILSGISLLGLVIEKVVPYDIPSIIYISLIGLFIALPISPIAPMVIQYTSQVDLASITTILLAYAGIAMGRDLKEFKEVGIRGIIVTFMVILGTYLMSALIAQGVLMYSGMI